MSAPAYAPASVRNASAILGILADELRHCRTLLEIGTGSAYHAVMFAKALPHIAWQPSDLDACTAKIRENLELTDVDNVLPPLSLDVRDAELPAKAFDAVYSCNTAHIMCRTAVFDMVRLAGDVLVDRGLFCCYGPFRREGKFSTRSNAMFDASLRSSDPAMGIRDLGEVNDRAKQAGLNLLRIFAMPANNLLVIWVRQERHG